MCTCGIKDWVQRKGLCWVVFAVAAECSTTTTYLWVDWTLNWRAQNPLKITRSTQPDNLSLSLLAVWMCNWGRYINHFVNHHRWWIGKGWRNICVGWKSSFPMEVFTDSWKHWLKKKSSSYKEQHLLKPITTGTLCALSPCTVLAIHS